MYPSDEDDFEEYEYEFCNHDYGYGEFVREVDGVKIYKFTCKHCGETEEEALDIEYADFVVNLKGGTFRPIFARGNCSVCAMCKKVILFPMFILLGTKESSKGEFEFELDFCEKCFRMLRILEEYI